MNGTIRTRLQRSNTLYRDLVLELESTALTWRLGELPSNTIGQQIWCVVGARESYLAAARRGAWAGFSCSLTDTTAATPILTALKSSIGSLDEFLAEAAPLDGAAADFLLDLLEHEAQHHGQLIRYLYGMRLPIPDSWKARYALS